jgi:hypothetical protein
VGLLGLVGERRIYTAPSIYMSTSNFVPVEKRAEPAAKKVDTMCSNCSGDDPKPESFAFFDVSSPKRGESFADRPRRKRKRYRTGRLFATYAHAALTLAIDGVHRSKSRARIIGSVDPGSFVNLNLGGSPGEYLAKLRSTRDAENLIEIRVSGDAITEVLATCGSDENTRRAYGLAEREIHSAWEESYVERNNLERTLRDSRWARRLKCFMAYGAFVTITALAVWCAVR